MSWPPRLTKTEQRERRYPLLREENVILEDEFPEHEDGFVLDQYRKVRLNLARLPFSLLADVFSGDFKKTGDCIEEYTKARAKIVECQKQEEVKRKLMTKLLYRKIFEKGKPRIIREARRKLWEEQWVSFTTQEIEEAKADEVAKAAEAERKVQEEEEFVFV